MIIVVVGYSGSNKINIGKNIAKKLDLSFCNLYNKIEEHEMLTTSEIINKKGNIFFRKIESKFLKQTIKNNKDLVLSVDEGTPCYSNNIKYINSKNVLSIYLKYSIDSLLENILNNKIILSRYSVKFTNNQLKEYIAKHLFERKIYYNKCKITIDCDKISESEIVEKVLFKLNNSCLDL